MTLETRTLERAFRYNSLDLVDPGLKYSAEEVRDLYTNTYPELANAAIEGPEQKDGKLVYSFRRPVGTKGAKPALSGIDLIAQERLRQVNEEGWTPEHDDDHDDHSLAMAACAYAAPEPLFVQRHAAEPPNPRFLDCWPDTWHERYDKRKFVTGRFREMAPASAGQMVSETYIRNLAKAGALIAAEIDRIRRAQATEDARASA